VILHHNQRYHDFIVVDFIKGEMMHKKQPILIFLLTLASLIFMVVASSALAQDATPEATEEPAPTEEAADGEEPFILLNVPIKSGGIEVFPEPDRTSGRLFAALGDFAPHIAGISEDGEWFFIYYFEDGELKSGWARVSRFDLSDIDPEDLEKLPVIDPENLPELPDLEPDEAASRPVGTRPQTSGEDGGTVPTATEQPTGGDSGGGAPPPPPPPSGGDDSGGGDDGGDDGGGDDGPIGTEEAFG
jgi:hypothetical protein